MKTENDKFPGRPNYTGPRMGWFGLLHHDELFEYSNNVVERIGYVIREKPKKEIEVRLNNMIYIDFRDISSKLFKAWGTLDKARNEWYKAQGNEAELEKAMAKLEKAREEWDTTLGKWDTEPEILNYIKKYNPECAWDEEKREMIFEKPKEGKK